MRKRFKAEEKIAFVPGALVEWQNGSHWRAAEVVAPIGEDGIGYACVRLIDQAPSTATVGKGDTIYGYPGKIRLRP